MGRRHKTRILGITLITLLAFFLANIGADLYAAPRKSKPVRYNTISDADRVAAAKTALQAAGTLEPEQGSDTNVANMAQKIVNQVASDVIVRVTGSSNPQVSSNGLISYGDEAGSGSVTCTLTKNAAADSAQIWVEVPAAPEADTDQEAVTAAQEALMDSGILKPVEGTDACVVDMAQDIVDDAVDGVIVSVSRSDNAQVSSSGVITYGSSAVTGGVTFKLVKNITSATQAVTVAVPAHVNAVSDTDAIYIAKYALINSGTMRPVEGVDTSVVDIAQAIADKAVDGVTVSVSNSANAQVSSTGVITYSSTAVTGVLTFRVEKNSAVLWQAVTVAVPAHVYTVTDTDVVKSAQAALVSAGTLKPVEGTDTSALTMAQAIVNKAVSGVTVSVSSSANAQVSSSGAITYGSSAVTGMVTFKLTKNSASVTQAVTVAVPAHVSAVTDTDVVKAAQAALVSAGTLKPVEGTDTSALTMAQAIVNKAVSGVTVSVSSSANAQVSSSGAITYGSSAVTGMVTFKLTKNSASVTQAVTVAVPAKTVITILNGYNVKDYGAKGDGVTNDAAAFNSAITAASNSGGGTVYVPAGTYKISLSTGIAMKNNVTLSMYGATLFDHSVVSGKNMITIGNGVTNVQILGGILEGPAQTAGASENYQMGIMMWESPSQITIKDVEIRYFQCDGMYLGCATTSDGAPNRVLVEGCYIHHCGRNGISMISQRSATYRNNEISYIGLNSKTTSTGAGMKFEANASSGKNWVGESIVVEGNNIHHCNIFGIMVSDYWDRSNPYHPVSINLLNNQVHDNAALRTSSYSINSNNCLEFATYSASRWVKWDGTLYSSSQQNGLRTW